MMKLKSLFIAVIALAVQVFAVSPVAKATAAAEETVTPYTIDFNDANLEEKLYSAYIPSGVGGAEELSAHWSVENDVLKRVNDCGTADVTGSYAVTYLNGCYLRYFELNTKVAYGNGGLTGIVFGKNDVSLRHLGDGNALYFMPDPCVELGGSTITQTVTSSKFGAKTDFYDVKMVVCADYVKVWVDGVERIQKTLPSDLLKYGRIGLFTANAPGSFADGVEVYNLDAQGNRIAFDPYTATTGVTVTEKTVEMNLLDEKVKFNYVIQPENATVQGVRFLSVSPDIAVVDNEGYIHPLKAGVTEIQVITSDGGFKDSIIVTVTETIPELEGVALDKASAYLAKAGDKLYLSASYFPEEAENLGFKWSTSNSKVAIVNNGTVTAMGEGTCVITVKDYYGNYTATCTITVGGGDTTQTDDAEEKGCGSILGFGCATTLLLSSAVVLLRKKEK
jgi:hypothetical protein